MHRLLIIKPSSLGDIVHGLQTAASIHEQIPGVSISWVVRDVFAPLVAMCEAVDQVFVLTRNEEFKHFLRLSRELRRCRYDSVFDLQGLARSGLMTFFSRADRKFGRTDAREGAQVFYNSCAPLPPSGRKSHALEILLQFCPFVGAQPRRPDTLTFREPAGVDYAAMQIGHAPIVMFPDSRRPEKRWPGFEQLTEILIREDPSRRVIWAGGDRLEPPAELGERLVNLTGKLALRALPGLIRRADWVIANDSGPMHLAAAFGVKTLAIFGPTDPHLYGPYPLDRVSNHVITAPEGDLSLLDARTVFAEFQRLQSPAQAAG